MILYFAVIRVQYGHSFVADLTPGCSDNLVAYFLPAMSLQALGDAQSPLAPHNSLLPSAIPHALSQGASSSAPRENDGKINVIVEVQHTIDLEQSKGWVFSTAPVENTERSSTRLNFLQRLTFEVGLLIDKVAAVILRGAQRSTHDNVDHCSEGGLGEEGDKRKIEGLARNAMYSGMTGDLDDTIESSCSRLGVCKDHISHSPNLPWKKEHKKKDEAYLYDTGDEGKKSPNDWKFDNRTLNEIPQYVLDYAPFVYLFSSEHFWPCDIADHLNHVTPNLNYTPILSRTQNLDLTNLNDLNEYDNGRFVYLKSDDNVEQRPDWLGGQKNIPDEPEETEAKKRRHPHQKPDRTQTQEPPAAGGRSSAPAILITVNKGHGIVDAFWFYFYSYNLGNVVLNVRFGNHIGDWEHTLVRFQHGKPKIVFFSEHFFGQAYTYDAVEKIGQRPVVYSAVGTHAMYPRPGLHPYILPLGILHDQTDRGPLWDPLLNTMSYTYDTKNDTLSASNYTSDAPTEWFFFNGHWGDKLYPMDDSRQYEFVGQYHYVTGPLGPRFKHLGRRKVCQGPYKNKCVIKQWLEAEGEGEIPIWPGPAEGEGESEAAGELYDRQGMHA